MTQVRAFASIAVVLLLASGCAGVESETATSSPMVKDLTLEDMPPGWQHNGEPPIYYHDECLGKALLRKHLRDETVAFSNSQISNSRIVFVTQTALPDHVSVEAMMTAVRGCSGELDPDMSRLSKGIGGSAVYVRVSNVSADFQDLQTGGRARVSIEALRVYSKAKINPDPNARPTSSVVYIAFIKGERGLTHVIEMWTLFQSGEAPFYIAFREVLERIVPE